MSLNILIVSPQMLKDRTALHTNVEDKLILPEIKAAQDMYLLPLLGSALFDKIIGMIGDSSIGNAPNADYKNLVDNYLIDMMVNYVMSELPLGITYQIWNKGVATKTTDSSNTPSMSELFDIASKYKQRAEYYEKRARKFLQQYGPTKLAEYLNPGNTIDTVRPERTDYSSPIFLGEETHVYKSFEEKYQGYNPQCC